MLKLGLSEGISDGASLGLEDTVGRSDGDDDGRRLGWIDKVGSEDGCKLGVADGKRDIDGVELGDFSYRSTASQTATKLPGSSHEATLQGPAV